MFANVNLVQPGCSGQQHVWLTLSGAGDDRARRPLFLHHGARQPPICHQHIQIGQEHIYKYEDNTTSFWSARWRVVREYLMNSSHVETVTLTDSFDVFLNNITAAGLLGRFHALTLTGPKLAFAAEDACWVGRFCTDAEVATFKNARSTSHDRDSRPHKFMHSQMMGARFDVLRLLDWAHTQRHTDDMRLMYEYILAHPSRVVLDLKETIFATLARASPDTKGRLRLWSGKGSFRGVGPSYSCQRADGVVTLAGGPREDAAVTPVAWHMNGASWLFLRAAHDSCMMAFAGKGRSSPMQAVPRGAAPDSGSSQAQAVTQQAEHLLSRVEDDTHAKLQQFKNVLSPEEDERARNLLRHLSAVCKSHGIDFFLDGGTLVGSMLHHGRIPWDDDLDVYINHSHKEAALKALAADGFVLHSGPGSRGLYHKMWNARDPRVPNHRPWNWPYLDIGWLDGNSTHVWEARSKDATTAKYRHHVYPREWIYPAVDRPFDGLVLSAPRDGESMLRWRMGASWRERCAMANWDHKREAARDASLDVNTITWVNCSKLLDRIPMVVRIPERDTDGSHSEALRSSSRTIQTARFDENGSLLALSRGEPSQSHTVEPTGVNPLSCPPELAVLILSRPTVKGGSQRQAARTTWAHWSDPCAVRFWFVLGDGPIATPHVDGDVLRLAVPEGYTSISLKVVHALHWLVSTMPSFNYALKTDDDSFVCVGGLLRLLRGAPATVLYAGKPNWQRHPVRTEQSGHKFHDPAYLEAFGSRNYSDYHHGAGYVLAAPLAQKVVSSARRLGLLSNLSKGSASAVEDAWVGALARDTGLLPSVRPRIHTADHSVEREPEIPISLSFNLTSCMGQYLIIHKVMDAESLHRCSRTISDSPPRCNVRFGPGPPLDRRKAALAHHAGRQAAKSCSCFDHVR